MVRSGPYRVIVADDEPEFRGWLRSLLENSEDFQIVGEASSGAEAVQLIPSVSPDLVIADMYMPEPDGLEVAKYVQDLFPNTKAILVSAHEERVYQRLAKEAGALTFIPKVTFSLDALRQALREAA
jgi:two-component system response regulator DesR